MPAGTASTLAPLLLAVLLLVSGAVKLRTASRAGMGVHLPSVLELLSGGAVGLLGVAGALPPERGVGVAVAGVLLVLGSALHLARALAHRNRIRGLTEGRRLETFVRYLAESDDDRP